MTTFRITPIGGVSGVVPPKKLNHSPKTAIGLVLGKLPVPRRFAAGAIANGRRVLAGGSLREFRHSKQIAVPRAGPRTPSESVQARCGGLPAVAGREVASQRSYSRGRVRCRCQFSQLFPSLLCSDMYSGTHSANPNHRRRPPRFQREERRIRALGDGESNANSVPSN